MKYKDDLDKARQLFEEGEYSVCKAIYIDDKQKHSDQPKNINSGYVIFGVNDIHLIKKMATVRLFNLSVVPDISSGYYTNKKRFIATRVLW